MHIRTHTNFVKQTYVVLIIDYNLTSSVAQNRRFSNTMIYHCFQNQNNNTTLQNFCLNNPLKPTFTTFLFFTYNIKYICLYLI